MKAAINGRTFGVSEPGGAVQVSMEFAKAFDQDGSDAVYFGPTNIQDEFENTSSKLFPAWGPSQFYGVVWERTVLPLELRNSDFDVFFAANGNAPPFSLDIPTIMLVHGVGFAVGNHNSRIQRLYRRAMLPPAAKRVDKIITVSDYSKENIVEHLSVNPSKVEVIPPGLDSIYFDEDAGAEMNLPDRYVLSVGGLTARKNLHRVIKAVDRLNDELTDEYDLIVAGPEDKASFESVDIDFDEIDFLDHRGFVSIEELRTLYEEANAFMYPSLYEGFGIPPLEAAAVGTPVVSSNRRPMTDNLGDAPLYVNPESVDSILDALKEIVSDDVDLDDNIERGLEIASEYQWSKSRSKLRSLAKELI